MYLKISTTSKVLSNPAHNFSLKLSKNEQIINIKVIDREYLLILIDKDDDIRGAIYNINKNEVIRFIDR